LFERVVEERDPLLEHLAEVGRSVRRRQRKPCIGFARFGDDRHALLSRQVHHGAVFRQAVHEERAPAPIAGTQMGTREQRAAHAAAALALAHRNAELRPALRPGEMRDADEAQIVG